MLHVVQAFDRAPVADVETDDGQAIEAKLATATEAFRNRRGWLKPYQRIDVLRRLAVAIEGRREHFAGLIAREGGKPRKDALVEVDRAVDGVHNATDELRNFAGREIPMGLTAASRIDGLSQSRSRSALSSRSRPSITCSISLSTRSCRRSQRAVRSL